MIITCPHCKTSRDVGDIRLPQAGITATCKSCHGQFPLYPEDKAEPPAPEPARFGICPGCGFAGAQLPETDICPKCGLVFSKYRAKTDQLNQPLDGVPFLPSTPADEPSLSRQILTNKLIWGIALTILIAAWIRFGHDWKLDRNYLLQPGNWQGEMSFRGKQHPFMLVIQSTDGGKLEGYMDWIETMPRYRLAIRGTHDGNHLLFEDYKFLEGEGQYGLHDKQDVYIVDNEMSGTAKNGQATLHAIQVATSPDSSREPMKN